MLNLCTPEAPNRKFFLGTSSSRKQKNLSLKKMNMNFVTCNDKENETPNVNLVLNYNETTMKK